jgi:hypothetical protein
MSHAAEIKLAEQWLCVLELVQALGNVSAAGNQAAWASPLPFTSHGQVKRKVVPFPTSDSTAIVPP